MILITGATGHLGNVLVRTLCAQGERVRVLVLPDDRCTSIDGLNVECAVGNVLDFDSLREAMTDVDLVYHLAGIISIMPGREELMWRVNVEGVRNVGQAALQAGVQRVVHVSSIHAFKSLPHGTVVDESAPLALDAPTGSYNRTKAEGTLRMLETIEQGLDAVIVCPTGIIGPYDYLHSEMGSTIQDFTQRKVHVLVKGAYDFVDVRDVVAGLQQAGNQGKTGELYILSGHKVTLTDLRRSVQDLMGTQTPVFFVPFGLARAAARMLEPVYKWTGQTPRFTTYSLDTVHENALFSHNKATRTFNYRPRPLQETLKDTLAWREQLD